VREVYVDIARSSILYLQDVHSDLCRPHPQLQEIARRWDASMELMLFARQHRRWKSEGFDLGPEQDAAEEQAALATADLPEQPEALLSEAGRLRKLGFTAGCSAFCGDARALAARVSRMRYSMVVVGELFHNDEPAVRTRLKTEFRNFLAENTRVPVVDVNELQEQFRFGAKPVIKVLASLLVAAIVFASVFLFGGRAVELLKRLDSLPYKIAVSAIVLLVAPVFAFAYGSSVRRFLKLLRLD
jgi:hypothetical protein